MGMSVGLELEGLTLFSLFVMESNEAVVMA